MATGIGGVDDAAFVFDEATEPDGSEVDVEEPVINLLEADVVAGEKLADADAIGIPADASVCADESGLEVPGIGDWLEAGGEGSM